MLLSARWELDRDSRPARPTDNAERAEFAMSYQAQSRYADAEPLFVEVLEIDRRMYGDGDIDEQPWLAVQGTMPLR